MFRMAPPNDSEPARTGAADAGPVRDQALATIRSLTLELHPEWRQTLDVRPESDLDRDLGFDSLGRAELLMRLNREFGIGLCDQLIVEASTASDICKAVSAASPRVDTGTPTRRTEATDLPESSAPTDARTLLDVLAFHVREHAERPHVLLWRSDAEEEHLCFGELDDAARRIAHGLLEEGVEPGDRVAIMLPTGLDFFRNFYGILMAGGVPVPIYPPLRAAQLEEHLRRQAGILRNAEVRTLVTDVETRRVVALLYGIVPGLKGVRTTTELRLSGGRLEALHAAAAQETALIQYTSGSTGDPKGVVLSHANLLANIRAMGQAMEATSADVFVSWLPLYHDMGLIGAWLGGVYHGVPVVIMSPLAFIADPARWLWAIHRHRATLSAAPNFAFELCLKRVADADLDGLDLSSLRMVANGAEPVSPRTIARFAERFGRYGFDPRAMAPVYGLAENSVGLAFPPVRRGPVIDRVDRRALTQRGVALPAAGEDAAVVELPSCGRPLPGHQIRIIDATGREIPERQVGRLEFQGPSATAGYFRNPEKTAALIHGDWLDSGDLAYAANGEIYVTGRVKDIIIRAGRNIYPQELEELVGGLQGVRKGCVAVVSGPDETSGTERLIVVAESALADPTAREGLSRRISDASVSILESPPDEVVLVPPHAIPKTSSGKIRRAATRQLYEAGALGRIGRPLWWQLGRLAISGSGGWLRRSLGTAGKFAYAAWWWTVLVGLACIVWPLVMVLPRRNWRHAAVGNGIRFFFKLTGIRFTVERSAEDVPLRDVVIVSNHSSYLDGGVISAAIPGPLGFLVAARFGRQFVAGSFLRRLGTIFVGDAEGELSGAEDAAVHALEEGERVVIFPEGRLRRMPGLLSFYPGPFLISASAGVPVVPVTLRGTRSVLRNSRNWFPRRAPIHVNVGKPIRPEGSDFEAAVKLSRAVRAEVLRESREPDLGGEVVDFGIPMAERR
jgi:1-acyl-sn-glycerol-3-phosphate acyltransferase